jgi:CHAT domain-containing protein
MKLNPNDHPERVSPERFIRFLDADPVWDRTASSEMDSEVSPSDSAGGGCPSTESLLQVAIGIAETVEASDLLTHAAECGKCGKFLAGIVSALEGNSSPEEAAAIEELATAQLQWQADIALRLAKTPIHKRPRPFMLSSLDRRIWIGLTAVAAGLLVGVGGFIWQRHASAPELQLAVAYEQSRTLELRVADAGFTAMTAEDHTRGAIADHEPPALLEARAHIARDLEKSPQDTHLLQLQARADVLEERYDSATDVLDRLIAHGPVTADLLVDAATAYFQRGLASGSELDRSTALEYLSRADAMAPADPVVLFNEAIVMEDRGQMMNAVEVWNRFITVERDTQWAAEGKRKLAALEQKLNRLKTHESRVGAMLGSPEGMEALAQDRDQLGSLDEELAFYELEKIVDAAFPSAADSPVGSSQRARGSPCAESCLAARSLLKAIGKSLELQHHDNLLSDLISPDFNSLPKENLDIYASALRMMVRAERAVYYMNAGEGGAIAHRSRELFQELTSRSPRIHTAAEVGVLRSASDELLALQLQTKFKECRDYSHGLRDRLSLNDDDRYPWIQAQLLITEKNCDDLPVLRNAGRAFADSAFQIASRSHYRLLTARIHQMMEGDAQDAGDIEQTEALGISTLRDLYEGDPPPLRLEGPLGIIGISEKDSSRPRVAALFLRESIAWCELGHLYADGETARLSLAQVELRFGATRQAEADLVRTQEENRAHSREKLEIENQFTQRYLMANALLDEGDLKSAGRYLDAAEQHLKDGSDIWEMRNYATIRGRFELLTGNVGKSANILESAIQLSEGTHLGSSDRVATAAIAEEDHDAYGELAATWLSQGRSPESVLALWERFRLRSRGLPVTTCAKGELDCERPRLEAEQKSLGEAVLIGQIVLADRVLVYRMDSSSVHWNQNSVNQRDLMDAARSLEQAVTSPTTSPETAGQLGQKLSWALLPTLPASNGDENTLFLEPDPNLANLSWPVLPTPAGPLGLRYPIAELRSILIVPPGKFSTIRGGTPLQDQKALIIGASVTGDREPPLPEAMREALSVKSMLASSQVLLGEQATDTHVAQRIETARIIHFAGHALQTRNGTELLLAATSPTDSSPWIDGKFLSQHPPRACKLAVLSACSTGTHSEAWNHPLQNIVETLGAMSVPEIVATRWQVDSAASVPFMEGFYGAFEKGDTVARALTLARRQQSSQPAYRNPYYWGAYYVSGRENFTPGGELHASIREVRSSKR